jgi:hypothetical protein
MNGPHSAFVRDLGSRGFDLSAGERKFGESSVDFLLGARIDSEWIVRKTRTKFNLEVIQNLKKAIYGIGQGARRWFSGGEISERQASMILDYAVLVELLLECRDDLQEFRDDLVDCREQLLMQISRYTEGQPERVVALVEVLVRGIRQQLAERVVKQRK